MVRYLGNKEDQLWKIFLKEKINKCGGCGDSAIFMVLRKGMLKGLNAYQREVMSAWGESLKYVRYECVNVQQVWEQPIFLNPRITHEKCCLFNLPMWRAGMRRVKDFVLEYVPGFMRAQVIVDEVREIDEVMYLGTAERMMKEIKDGMPSEWLTMIESEIVIGKESVFDLYVGKEDVNVKIEMLKQKICING